MNQREQRGVVIAALCKLNKREDNWLVPSQSKGETIYQVNPSKQTCTCPDHAESGHKCKHLYAVEFTMKREMLSDGTVIDTQTVTFTEKKVYKQNWPKYNAAQSVEKDRIQELLFDLCKDLQEPERKTGRKPHSVKDVIFSLAFKVYSTFSARRFSSDLREAHARGFTQKVVPGIKTTAFMEDEVYTPILKALIVKSALPLKSVEDSFAIDSSGFGSSKFERWYDQKYGITRQRSIWTKVHIASGTRTNIVTAVRILDKDAADNPQFAPLVKETARNFTVGEVSADKAYLSYENFETVAECGGTFFPMFKDNTTALKGGLFQKMFHYFQFKQEEYLAHYHRRSNVESTFSMIKRKFGDAVRSKTPTAMVNECLCKILCHNLCCVIQEQHELGIDAVFFPPAPTVLQIADAG